MKVGVQQKPSGAISDLEYLKAGPPSAGNTAADPLDDPRLLPS